MSNSVEANTTDTKIVDDIIHYLKLNNAGHIDRDNVVDIVELMISERKSLIVDSYVLDNFRGMGMDDKISIMVESTNNLKVTDFNRLT